MTREISIKKILFKIPLIHKFGSKIKNNILRHVKWYFDYIRVIKDLKTEDGQDYRTKILDVSNLGETLVIAPHCDDELVGCYNIIKNNSKRTSVYCFGLSPLKTKDDKDIRIDEIEKLQQYFGFTLLTCSRLENDSDVLLNFINQRKCLNIFVPSLYDWHDEHFYANTILISTLKKLYTTYEKPTCINIYMYEVSCSIPKKLITSICPMSKNILKHKWKIFNNYYSSQKEIPTYRFKLNEKINGKQYNCFSADVFSLFTVEKYINTYEGILQFSVQRKNLVKYINDLRRIREKTDELNKLINN